MRKALFIFLLFVLTLNVVYSEPSRSSENWLAFSYNEKRAILFGFALGLQNYNNLIIGIGDDAFADTKLKENVIELMFTILKNFYNENIDYWIKEMDAFYTKKSNIDIHLPEALNSVIVISVVKQYM